MGREEELNVVLGDVHGSGELVGRHVEYVGWGLGWWCFKGREGLAYLKKRSLDCDWSVCKSLNTVKVDGEKKTLTKELMILLFAASRKQTM